MDKLVREFYPFRPVVRTLHSPGCGERGHPSSWWDCHPETGNCRKCRAFEATAPASFATTTTTATTTTADLCRGAEKSGPGRWGQTKWFGSHCKDQKLGNKGPLILVQVSCDQTKQCSGMGNYHVPRFKFYRMILYFWTQVLILYDEDIYYIWYLFWPWYLCILSLLTVIVHVPTLKDL